MKDSLLIIGISFITILIMIIVKKYINNKKENEPYPFYKKEPLTKPEKILYQRLINALPEYIILSQVQLSRFLGVKKGFNFHQWNNRINRMSIDFLICNKDFNIITAVELDDKSHEKPERIKADKKKNKALADAGIKLIRWNVKTMPNEKKIAEDVNT